MKVLAFVQCGVHASNIVMHKVEAEIREFKASVSFIMSSRPAFEIKRHFKSFKNA